MSISFKSHFLKTSLIVLMLVTLTVAIRIPFLRYTGNPYDMGLNQAWTKSATLLGIAESYKHQLDGKELPNYLPGTLILWAAAGHLYQYFVSDAYEVLQPIHSIFVKSPAFLADVIIVVALYLLLLKMRHKYKALVGALIYAMHPAVIHNSSYWGQTDAIYSAYVLLALIGLVCNLPLLSGVCTSLFVLGKPQGIIFLPLIILTLPFRLRYQVRFWLGSIISATFILLPFILDKSVGSVIHILTVAVGSNHNVSANAYNFWWSVLAGRTWFADTDLLYDTISYRHVGFIIFGIIYATTLLLLRKNIRPKKWDEKNIMKIFSAFALISNAFFLYNTEMHERYMFPFIVFGIVPALFHKKYALLYTGITVLLFLNVVKLEPWPIMQAVLFDRFPLIDIAIASWQVALSICLIWMTLLPSKISGKHKPVVPQAKQLRIFSPVKGR